MIQKYDSDHPYFIYPAVMQLRNGVDDEAEAQRLRRIVAANVGDIPSLRLMLGIDPEEFASFYPDLTARTLSTTDTISSFLSHFGRKETPLPAAAATIPDLSATGYNHPDESDNLHIANSAEDSEPLSVARPAEELTMLSGAKTTEEEGENPFSMAPTEQNARILIKNRDYQGALEIIRQLSLNIPEKSVYFADQIRFLKKLILNEAHKSV